MTHARYAENTLSLTFLPREFRHVHPRVLCSATVGGFPSSLQTLQRLMCVQVSAQTAPFAFASSYPDLMPPQPTANPMFAQAPQGYYMAPLNSAPAVDVATGMPLGPAFGTAVAGNPLLHPGAAEPHAPVNKPHPLSQDTAPPRQMSAGASQDAMLRPVRKQSCDLGSEDNQNHHNNS